MISHESCENKEIQFLCFYLLLSKDPYCHSKHQPAEIKYCSEFILEKYLQIEIC